MALLFSAVRATANDQEVEFFVGGIPREYDDLEGWTAFDRFIFQPRRLNMVSLKAEVGIVLGYKMPFSGFAAITLFRFSLVVGRIASFLLMGFIRISM